MNFPQIGETLPNGYTVQAAYCVGHDRYVLAHRGTAPSPYAVWDVDQDGDTRNGHYFSDPVAAQKRFAYLCFNWFDVNNDPYKPWCKDHKCAVSFKTMAMKCGIPSKIKIDTGEQETATTNPSRKFTAELLLEQ